VAARRERRPCDCANSRRRRRVGALKRGAAAYTACASRAQRHRGARRSERTAAACERSGCEFTRRHAPPAGSRWRQASLARRARRCPQLPRTSPCSAARASAPDGTCAPSALAMRRAARTRDAPRCRRRRRRPRTGRAHRAGASAGALRRTRRAQPGQTTLYARSRYPCLPPHQPRGGVRPAPGRAGRQHALRRACSLHGAPSRPRRRVHFSQTVGGLRSTLPRCCGATSPLPEILSTQPRSASSALSGRASNAARVASSRHLP
jgi:hypothetical protein